MSESRVFACPTCGASLTASGDQTEIKCQYCGSTVIVPQELRTPAPEASTSIVVETMTPPIVVGNLAPAVAGVGGIVGCSILAPIIITVVILAFTMMIVFVVIGQINSTVRSAFTFPTSTNSSVLTEVARIPSRAPATATVRPATAAPSATATLSVAPTFTASVYTNVFLKDNFADRNSGWDQGNFDGNTLEYVSGGYRMFIARDNSGETSWIKDGLSDVSVAVDARLTAGPEESWFGVLCRAQRSAGAYGFKISSAGRYEVARYKYSGRGNTTATLQRGALLTNLLTRGAAAHIRSDCIGSTLTLIVNDHTVAAVKDGDYSAGGVGLVAETGGSGKGGADVLFSNFMVAGP